ncbi:MAG: class I SAM-dependent methyltransferase [Planctomycetota bacterium]|jgi:SAM-dependent methyltransferase
MKIKSFIKLILKHTPFYPPVHIGAYIRGLYFWNHINKLPIKNFTKVLDAGCGRGTYAVQIAKMFPHIHVIGIDIRENFQNTTLSNIEWRQGNLLEMNENRAYDFIYSIDVLEHIPYNNKVIRNFYQALKEDGILYLHIPYDIDKKTIFPKKYFKEFNDWAKNEHTGKQYSLDELQNLLLEIGFDIVTAEYAFGFAGKIAWELDRMTDRKIALKIILMPFLKFLGQLSVKTKHRKGNILVIGKKNVKTKR